MTLANLLDFDWTAVSSTAALLVALTAVYGIFRKQQIQKIDERVRRIGRWFEIFHDGLIIVNRDNIIVDANRQARLITAYVDLVGRDFRVLIPERMRLAHENHVAKFHDSPHTRRMGTTGMELSLVDRYGREKRVRLSLTPGEDDYGGAEVMVGMEVIERST